MKQAESIIGAVQPKDILDISNFVELAQYEGPAPKLLSWNGRVLSSKLHTDIQTQQINIVKDTIEAHIQSLGISLKESNILIPKHDDIIFIDSVDIDNTLHANLGVAGGQAGCFNTINKLLFDKHTGKSFVNNIHEFLHFYSGKDNLYKSGFVTVSHKKIDEETNLTYRDGYFEFINEGVTEKLAQEIASKNIEGKKFFDQVYKKDKRKIVTEEELEISQGNFLAMILDENPDIKEKIDKAKEDKDIGEVFSLLAKVLSMPVVKEFIANIKLTENPYSENIVFVDLLIELLAYFAFRKNSNIDIETHKSQIWLHLQKAYFTGNLNIFLLFASIEHKKSNLMRLLTDMRTEDLKEHPKFYESNKNVILGIIDVLKKLPEQKV